MKINPLKWVAVILPVIFMIIVIGVRQALVEGTFDWRVELTTIIPILLGSFLFTVWVFSIVEKREEEIRLQSEQLAALHEAALNLTKELDLPTVLQKVVDQARTLVNARYGALGVLGDGGGITQFITSGISTKERGMIGQYPQGKGLLGLLISEGKAMRVEDISNHPKAYGFPPNHPEMKTMLGVPIRYKNKVIGNLYLADKLDRKNPARPPRPFNELDQQVLEMFAAQAAIAIENAQLYRQSQQLVLLEERERFGMDLHDGVIQSIYAVGLMLEDAEHRIDEDKSEAKSGIRRAIHGLNDAIRDIRNYILDLRPQKFQGRDLWQGLQELARDFRANTLLNIDIYRIGSYEDCITPEQTVEILHIVQEALTNVRKHAHASQVEINLNMDNDILIMTIEDNGIGMDFSQVSQNGGNGLRNMTERATTLRGKIHFGPGEQGGTCVTLYLPLVEETEDA